MPMMARDLKNKNRPSSKQLLEDGFFAIAQYSLLTRSSKFDGIDS